MKTKPIAMTVLLALLIPALAGAASLAERIGAVDDGRIRFHFASRPGVCGDGESMISNGDNSYYGHYRKGWKYDCIEGPVRVEVKVRRGDIVALRTTVGPPRVDRPEIVDLGEVGPDEAAAFLLDVVRDEDTSVAEDAILPMVLGRGVVYWPDLLEVARMRSRPRDVRRAAVFWVGQAAGEAATRGLVAIVGDDDEEIEVRKHAVFALSQASDVESVPRLTRIARNNPHPEIRKSALFWLAQSDDPRVLRLFEDILTDG